MGWGCTGFFFRPDSRIYDDPASLGRAFESLQFASTDGTRLAGLFLGAAGAGPLGTVLHFHGNGGNLTTHLHYSAWLTEHGFGVLIFDYRGYGESAGRPSQAGVVRDGIAALRYLRSRPDVDPDRILVLGQSLGAAVAVASLAEEGAPGVRAVALECPLSSYRSVASSKLALSPLLRPFRRPLAALLISDRFRPLDAVGRLPPLPLLILHGDEDEVVPYTEGVALYHAAREPKQFWTVPGGRHIDAFTRFGARYRSQLVQFFREALAEAGPAEAGS